GAKLQGYDIGIEVKEGTAILTGEVTDPNQKDKATQVASRAKGVKKVDNRLVVSPPKAVAAKQAEKQIQQAAAAADNTPPTNQQMAERIAGALGQAGMSGFDLEVRFQDGQALIGGAVANPAQRARITQVVSNLDGIESVDNKVTVTPQAAVRRPAGPPPYAQAGYGGGPMRAPIHPAAYQQEGGPMPGGPMPGGPMGGMPMPPMPMGRSNAGQVNDMPNLPNYAWPTYAQYPNSAAITYPKEYSASAWPYIGPFYPYPQVPLGWRSAQLEWDDGKWALNFRPRTEKWFWFLKPDNW
ncbi:MAG: BON domain-containing protein, partial [Planctomycetaceae bacterium]|nr:BON domain-containing protein [Planctomycetaceae bacterium]